MKKIITLFALFILLFVSAGTISAQIKFGAKAIIDLADNPIKTSDVKISNRFGMQIGPTVDISVPLTGFGVDVGLLYGIKRYDVDTDNIDAKIDTYNYISIPVNLKKRFGLGLLPVGVFVTGGAYGNVKVSGSDFLHNTGDVVDKYKSKNFIIGLSGGLGVNILHKVDVGVYYRGDLTKKYGDAEGMPTKKFQSWAVGVNYFF